MTLRNLVLLFLISLAPLMAREKAQGYCSQGGQVLAVTSSLNSTGKVQLSYPSCLVTVYFKGTTSLATLYSDNSSTAQGNPFTAASTGLWSFYADNGRYDVRLSGGGIPSPFTLGDFFLWDSASLTSTIAAGNSSSVSLDAGHSSIFEITLNSSVSAFNLTGAQIGQIVILHVCQDANGLHPFTWANNWDAPPAVIQAPNACTSGQFYYNSSNRWKTISFLGSTSVPVNAKTDFGCKGDGTTDDTACFAAIRDYFYAFTTTSVSLAGTQTGGIHLYIPPGTYKITQAQTFMSSSYSGPPINGYVIEGAGDATVIDYNPGTPGPLFYNNNAVLGLDVKNIQFNGHDNNSDFFYSYSTSKAQNYSFFNCSWYNHFDKIFELHGTNTNSDFKFWGGGSYLDNVNSYFLYSPDVPTPPEDQFLFYDFYAMRIWNAHGNFLKIRQGGHIVVRDCDFSGNQGSGDVNNPSVFFDLRGNNHSFGIAHFICQGSRFELISDSLRVLYSDWGAYGEVNFLDDDWSSQALNYSATTTAFYIDYDNVEGTSANGPIYNFDHCSIIGKFTFNVTNTVFEHRRLVTIKNSEFLSTDDWATSFNFTGITPPTEVNTGAYPVVTCENCRGRPHFIYPALGSVAQTVWAPSTTYAPGYCVYSNTYTYCATSGGTSTATAANGPSTRSTALVDGTVTWTTRDIYAAQDYVMDGNMKPDKTYGPPNATNGMKRAFFATYNRSNLLPYRDAVSPTVQPRLMRAILPPFATVVRVVLYVQPGGNTSSSNVTYTFRTDEYTPTSLAAFTYNPLSGGGFNSSNVYFYTGTGLVDFGTRSIILYTNADQPAQGYAYIEYY